MTPVAALRALQAVLLLVAVGGAIATSSQADWQPTLLVVAIIGFALLSEPCPIEFKKVRITGSFMGVVLAMVVLGPAPAALAGGLTMLLNGIRRRSGVAIMLPNISTHALLGFAGGLAFELLNGPAHLAQHEILVVPIVVAVFMIANVVNFLLIALDVRVVDRGASVWSSLRSVYVEVWPAEFAISVLTGIVALAQARYSTGALVMAVVVGLMFQYLMRMAMSAADRKEQVEARNQQLAALQVGLISTTLKTLSLRDHMTARHSAAVARYAREIAGELGLDEREVDLIHTAALFHDIGKFIFPDSILLTDRRLTDEEYEIVKRHPEVGAELIGQIDGYESVAEIIRWHHERMDGRGYPDGLPGHKIPLGSRIISVADVYDVITARDTYRTPVTMSEAFAELRRSAGTQLDAELVEVFIGLVETRGVAFRHSTAADFEAELALDRRVRDYAAPRLRLADAA